MELFSPGHLIPLLIVAAILFFGWKQLPDMARSVGRSLRIFKTEMKGMSEDDKARADATTAPAQTPEPPAALPPATPTAPPAPSETPASTPTPAATGTPSAGEAPASEPGPSGLRSR